MAKYESTSDIFFQPTRQPTYQPNNIMTDAALNT